MAQCFINVFSSLLVILAAIEGTIAVDYTVNNTALATSGGRVFRDKIGDAYARETMDFSTQFIWWIFRQNSAADRKNVQKVILFVEDIGGVAFARGNEIHLSAIYVGTYPGDVKREVTGVLYHEMAHIWQWNGIGQANGGLIEGIADYVRLKAGYAPSRWAKPGQGDRWDQGYDVTAYFLDYCNSLRDGFVAELNKMMRTGYSDDFFRQLLGKSVDQLWRDYQAKFGSLQVSYI
ncbi:uncharacterized protein LOC114737427 [Neltuma alba]|uniref:uncharacterized protein LOC114737427 n=1 Tax=Neltuma alba TaxID=207710 RepID=UPI0010A2F354|nr:uncharacterized protein LOC114737427 [Prosopis alba]